MGNLKRSLYAGLILSLLLTVPAWAQETGQISGTVSDPDGAPLPGVAVTIGGRLVPESTIYTRENGTFRFLALPPGSDYSLTFALEGFATVVQEGVAVRLGGNTEIDVTMQLSTVEETVTVTGTSPVVDVKDTSVSANVTEEYMQNIPSARDPWVMMEHTAGVQVDRQNIGGSESGQQSGFASRGGPGGDTVWSYDGAEVTDMAATGASPFYYDFGAFEEISMTTAGQDPSVATGGLHINFVTKRGGNQWRGSARYYITDGDWQQDNVADPDTGELTGEFAADELYPGYIGNSIDRNEDYGGEIGGPLVRDHVFVWGAYGKQDINALFGTTPDSTQLENWHAKGTAHLGDKDVLNFTYVKANKVKSGRGASASRPGPTTWDQGGPSPVYTGKLQHTFSDNFYAEGSFNYTGLGFFLEPKGGRDTQVSLDLGTGLWGRSFYFYDTDRPLYNAKVDGNAYVAEALGADHEVKFGYSYRDSETTSVSGYGGNIIATFINGTPYQAWLTSIAQDHYLGKRHSVYVGDTITTGRVTLNLGLRYDKQTSEELESSTPASSAAPDLFPAVAFDGNDPGFGWNSISPRFGLTYDLTGDASTILKVSASRYYSQMAGWELAYKNITGFRELDLTWNDANGNGFVDAGETGEVTYISSGWDPAAPAAPSPNVITETDAPWTNELIVGVEHQVSNYFGVGVRGIYRKYGGETWAPRAGEIDDDFWVPITQDIDGYGTLELFEPAGPRSQSSVYQQREDYNTDYKGLEFSLNKRLSNKWMANAAVTLSTTSQNFEGPLSYTDPTDVAEEDGNPTPFEAGGSGRSGTYYGSAEWYLTASGMYQLPAGFNIAGFFQARQGYINPKYVLSNTRAFGAGDRDVWVEDFGDTKLPTYWDVDFRLEKSFGIADVGRIHLIADAFNLFNNDIVLAQHQQQNSVNADKIREVMQGRTIRFGARLTIQ